MKYNYRTVRIWNGSNCIAELKGHSLAVWAVISLDNGDIVSGIIVTQFVFIYC